MPAKGKSGNPGPDPVETAQRNAAHGEIKALLGSPELRRIFDDEASQTDGARPALGRAAGRSAHRGRSDNSGGFSDALARPAVSRANRKRRILVGLAPVYLAALILFFETVREPSLLLQVLGAPSAAEETHAMAAGSTPRAGMALRTAVLETEAPLAVPPAEAAPEAADDLPAARQQGIAVSPAAADAAAVFSDKAASDVAKRAADEVEPAPSPAEGAAPELPKEAPLVLAAAGNRPLAGPYPDPRAGLAPVAVPIDPAVAAAAEEALGLSRGDRREIQRRLRFADSDPQMIDGVFGPATRSAIAAWQEQAGLPATGFMDEPAMAMLVEQTAGEYRTWRAAERARAKEQKEQSDVVASSAPPRWPRPDSSECRRLPSGELAFGRDVGCNFRAFGENFKRDLRDLKGNLRQLWD